MTRVLATDLDNERILELLRRNVKRNSALHRGTVTVQALGTIVNIVVMICARVLYSYLECMTC